MHGTEYAGSATHVELHLVHFGARFQRDAAAVEGNAFAYQDIRLVAGFAALVMHHNKFGGLHTAGGNRQQ